MTRTHSEISPDRLARRTGSVIASPRAAVLLVDDKPARLLTYEAVLSGLNVDCVRAYSGREALEKLLTQEFAVILLDVNMPEMDGFEVARIIRGHPNFERTPIVFITGMNVSEFDRLKGYQVGAIDYMIVPIIPEILRSKVSVFVELHQQRNELLAANRALEDARARLTVENGKAIADKEAHRRAVFEHPSDLIIVLEAIRDDSGAITDWVYRNANGNALRLLDQTIEQLVGRRLSAVLPALATRTSAVYTDTLSKQEPTQYESRYADRDFLITVFPIGDDLVAKSGVDITERKHAEAALTESEQKLKLIYDNVSDCLFLVRREPGDVFRFISVNETFLRVSGYTREQVEGSLIEDVLPQANHELIRYQYGEALRTGSRVIYDETAELPAGRRHAQITLMPICSADGSIGLISGAIKDVTVERQAEDALREANVRKDQFLAMLAHELRNPLAPIRNVGQILARENLASSIVRQQSAILERQTRQLTRLVDDLLDVSRITQGKIELERAAVPVDEMLEGALESVRPALEAKRQSATVIGTNDSFFVTGDSARLNQIFVNLFVNASKYSPQDTKIIITIERQDSTALIRIKDEGIGIDAVTLPHIFELFVQADHSLDHRSGGLGIGLTIVKTLVEMHGGRVEVRSAGLGHGTEFTVHLPLASAP